jgi:VCBS repeat-containing protein
MVSRPAHGTLSGTAPNLTYTPDKNFNGSDSFLFKVNDGIADSAPATVSITVASVNDPPVANDDAAATREDTPIDTIDVLANDTDIDNEGRYLYLDTLSLSEVTQGKNGLVAINPDGSLRYSPDENFFGTDEFTYTVADNKGAESSAKVTVTVSGVNDAPAITSTPVTTAAAGTQYAYDVNAVDPDLTNTLTFSLTTKPDGMTIDAVTGLIKWKPDRQGQTEVTVQVADSNSIPATDTQSFTVTVTPPPPKKAGLTPRDGYYQRTRSRLSASGKTQLVGAGDDRRFAINYSSYASFDFSCSDVPNNVRIKSVVLFVEHYEEEGFSTGRLQWAVGSGWPDSPDVWASINPPVHENQWHESVDTWDITSLVETREKLNSLQMQIKNSDYASRKQTMIDHIYLVVEWE